MFSRLPGYHCSCLYCTKPIFPRSLAILENLRRVRQKKLRPILLPANLFIEASSSSIRRDSALESPPVMRLNLLPSPVREDVSTGLLRVGTGGHRLFVFLP